MMLRIRIFEDKTADIITKKEVLCPCHLYVGQEAVAVGVCSVLKKSDFVFSTHRSHGHYLAKGGNLKKLMAELYGKRTGCSKGRGGSMHVASANYGLPGSSAIVAGTIPIAVGAALGSSQQHKDSVSVAFFGDGAVCEGVFYEAINFAALKKLPVVFVCENNLYSTHMHISKVLADTNIHKKAEAFGFEGIRINGNDVIEVFNTAKDAIEKARKGGGPTLIECMTYRWRGHVGPEYDLEKGLRSKEELDCWMKRCPIISLEKILFQNDLVTETEMVHIKKAVEEEVKEAIKFAKESLYPESNENELYRYLFK